MTTGMERFQNKKESTSSFTYSTSITKSHGSITSCLIADLALSNKLVVYNLEDQTIGWTEYNCKYIIMHSISLDFFFSWFKI